MLNIYTNKTPNYQNYLHVLYSNFSDYLNYLSADLLTSIAPTNYSYNSNNFILPLDNKLSKFNFKNVTYIVDTETQLCYFVDNAIIQSGYAIFNCSIDHWGSYISNAKLNNLEVLKTNRNIGIGIYDNISFTSTNESFRLPLEATEQVPNYENYLKYDNAVIVFLLKYEKTTQGSFGSITATDMFYIPISDIYKTFTEIKDKINPLEIAASFIGGIGRAELPNEGLTAANVTKAYIVPKIFINESTETNPVVSVDSYSKFGNKRIDVHYLQHIVKDVLKEISIDPNYDYYIGTPYDGLKLIRTNQDKTIITYRVTIDIDGLKVVVIQGGNQKDITSNFSVALTYNEGSVTKLNGILNGLSTLTGVFMGGLKMAGGNVLEGTLNVGSALASGMAPYLKNNVQLGQVVGSGDGFINMNSNNSSAGLALSNPLGYMRCKSNDNEIKHAATYGITFNEFIPNLATLFDYPFINNQCRLTYFIGHADISLIPNEAANVIKNKLQNGIYLSKI